MLLLLPLWREVGRLGRAFLSSWWSSLSVIFSPWGHTVWSKAQALCKALRVSCITRAIWRQTEAYRTLGRGPQLEREMYFFWGGTAHKIIFFLTLFIILLVIQEAQALVKHYRN